MEFNIASPLLKFMKLEKSGLHSKHRLSLRSFSKIVWLPVLIGLLFARLPGMGSVIPVRAQNSLSNVASEGMIINTGNYQIPQALLTALQIELRQIGDRSGGATAFGVGY